MSALKITQFSRSSTDYRFPGRAPTMRFKCSTQIRVPKTVQKLVDRIRERISNGKVEMSPSAYDTAWVAMVPSRECWERPSFPECLDWIMENQNPDGSWGMKDSLSSTLACLLALRRWNVGHQLLPKGIDFMECNGSAAATDRENQLSPIAFEVIFPAMINYANELDLALPTSLRASLDVRDSDIRKLQNLEYIAEGLGETFPSRNGSLFNSPATTAAAAIHCRDEKCFDYLITVVQKCGGWAPTVYPMDIYARLCMIDTLQRLGIDRHFRVELNTTLDQIYRKWQERDEEIFCDVTCLSLAFRLLRIKGYDVSSDELKEFVEQESFFNGVSMQHSSVSTVLELYRASQVTMNEDESTLEKIHAWTQPFLRQKLLNQSIRDKRLRKEVEYDLNNFYGTVDRFQNRRTIDLYDAKSSPLLKTAYRCSTIHDEDFIRLSIEDFKISRAQYLKELEQITMWYSDCRLDVLSEGRNTCHQSYILIAGFIADPELSTARISFAQAANLITVFDDFFDVYGTRDEAFTLIDLIKEWKPAPKDCSKQVEIIFTALYDTINEIAAKAYTEQGFCFKQQIIDSWVELLESAAREKECLSGKNVSSLDEYLSFAPVSIGCKNCVLTSVHFLGIQLSMEMLTSAEMSSLCRHGNFVCRLLNDLKTYKKGVTEAEAVAKVEEIVEWNRRKVVQMVYNQGKGSNIVPRECKELVWKACKMAYCFYGHDGDEFTSPLDIVKDMNAMMYDELPRLF